MTEYTCERLNLLVDYLSLALYTPVCLLLELKNFYGVTEGSHNLTEERKKKNTNIGNNPDQYAGEAVVFGCL